MDIKKLKYFITIVEEGQITAAAKRLHMEQPPLSQQLKNLEMELGIKLLKRNSKYFQLTDAGYVFFHKAKQIIELISTTEKEMLEFEQGSQGTLHIGITSSSTPIILSKKINIFCQTYPKISFRIHEGNAFEIIDLLRKGIIEIGFVRTPINTTDLSYIYTDLEPMIVAMEESFLWNNKSTCSISELENKPLIIYRRWERQITENCKKANFTPNYCCINDNAQTTLLWAKSGLGIAIAPKSSLDLICSSTLHYKTIKQGMLNIGMAVIWNKNSYLSQKSKKFIELFQ